MLLNVIKFEKITKNKYSLALAFVISIGLCVLTLSTNILSIHHHEKINVSSFHLEKSQLSKNELAVLNYFHSIDKKDYSKEYINIAESIRPLLQQGYGYNMALFILSSLYNSDQLTPVEEIYVLEKIMCLQQLTHDNIGAIKTLFSYMELAKQINQKYYYYYGKLHFAIIANNLGNSEKSKKLTNFILENAKPINSSWQQLIYDAYLLKADNEISNKDYRLAIKTLNNIDNKKNYISNDMWDDFKAFSLIQRSEAYYYLNDTKQGLEFLNQAKDIINKNNKIYFVDLYPTYQSVKILYAKNSEITDEKNISSILNIVSSLNYRYMSLIYKNKLDLLYKKNDFKTYHILNTSFINELEKRNKLSYELFYLNDKLSTNNTLMSYKIKKLTKYSFYFSLVLILMILLTFILIKMINHLKKIENIDGLTLLLNRRKFDIDYKNKLGTDTILCIFDVDNFKNINDEFGHDFGDTVLKVISKHIAKYIGKEHLYRIGGEEFAVIIKNTEENKLKLSQLPNVIAEFQWMNNLTITISAGCDNLNQATPFKSADNLLYRAKGSGKNKILF